jgi:hypothetical protein
VFARLRNDPPLAADARSERGDQINLLCNVVFGQAGQIISTLLNAFYLISLRKIPPAGRIRYLQDFFKNP